MFTVGLTGGIGSGKTFVSHIFESFGIEVIDADIISREVVAPGTPGLDAIIHHFDNDNEILNADGTLNRPYLREKIFSNAKEKKWLEKELHPRIREGIIQQLRQVKSLYAILSSPLLVETNQRLLVDRVAVVDVPREIQIQRVLERDQSPIETIEAIIDSQMPRVERLRYANDVIENYHEGNYTQLRVEELHRMYSELASRSAN